MNERIRELAEQADRWSQKMTRSDDPRYGGRPVSGLFEEKFAELIVRECSNMAESFQRHQYDFTGDLELHEFMKNHFGVEE